MILAPALVRVVYLRIMYAIRSYYAYTLSEFIAEGGVATDNCSIVNFVLLDENSTGTFSYNFV